MKTRTLWLTVLVSTCPPPACSRPQFYVGIQTHMLTDRQTLTLGKNGWNDALLEAYTPALTNLWTEWQKRTSTDTQNSKVLPFWTGNGKTPLALFKEYLDDFSGQIYSNRRLSGDFRVFAGAYVFRHESILLAIELFGGRAALGIETSTDTEIFKSNAPALLVEADNAGKFNANVNNETDIPGNPNVFKTDSLDLNPYANSLSSYMYLHHANPFFIQNKIHLTTYFDFGGAIRLGTLLKDRLFLYATLGGQYEWVDLELTSQFKGALPELTLFYFCNNSASLYNTANFGKETLSPKATSTSRGLQAKRLKFGLLCGLGAEVYVTRRLALRLDVSFTYFADSIFESSGKDLAVRVHHHPTRFGIGLVWRI